MDNALLNHNSGNMYLKDLTASNSIVTDNQTDGIDTYYHRPRHDIDDD